MLSINPLSQRDSGAWYNKVCRHINAEFVKKNLTGLVHIELTNIVPTTAMAKLNARSYQLKNVRFAIKNLKLQRAKARSFVQRSVHGNPFLRAKNVFVNLVKKSLLQDHQLTKNTAPKNVFMKEMQEKRIHQARTVMSEFMLEVLEKLGNIGMLWKRKLVENLSLGSKSIISTESSMIIG